jgi:peptide/nickel transport system substrate-binding protein
VRRGLLPRRDFMAQMASVGVTAPLAAMLLLDAGIAQSQPLPYKPTRRGGGGALRLIEWQGPTLLNPHFATGQKDNTGSRIFYEPLVQFDADANLQPVLAAELPSRENGGLAADGKSVVWKLKRGVNWHDGQPFTADDVVFNWQYATDPATAATTAGDYGQLKMEKIDTHTVRVIFEKPAAFWPGRYSQAYLIPKHLFAAFAGATSREAPNNNRPVGTGAYTFVEFKPADLLRAKLNPAYHQPNRPHFDTLEMKCGGEATSAARAVLQTGEYDFAGTLVVDDEVLQRMEAAGKGRVEILGGSSSGAIFLNFCDPAKEVDGERSHPKTRHPVFSDPAVRRAIGLLIDRQGLQRYVYGRQGTATGNWLVNPPRFRSSRAAPAFNIAEAAALLDAAGWKPGPDGVRVKDGRRLSLLFQASINSSGQKMQTVVKQTAQKAGIQLELKAVVTAVFFSSDAGNPDTFGKFNADLQNYSWTSPSPDPELMMRHFVSWEVCSKANQWQGANKTRWQDAAYDALFRAAEVETDAVKRAALFIRMNDRVVADGYVIPLISRNWARALRKGLVAPQSAWSNDMASLPDWYREA